MFPLYDLNPHRRFPWITILLIVANVSVMAVQGFSPSQDLVYRFGFIPKRVSELGSGQPVEVPKLKLNQAGQQVPDRQQPPYVFQDDPAQVYLTFITMMFLHGGWLHLLFNMWWLWVFGNNVEDRLGRFMFLCFYLLGGMVGTVCQWAFQPMSTVPVIGASGAVAAVLGGYAITYPKAMVKTLVFLGIPLILNLPAMLVLGFWFVAQLVSGFIGMQQEVAAQVAFWAHIGGFVAGVILMPFLALGAPPADSDWKREAEELFRFDDPRTRTE